MKLRAWAKKRVVSEMDYGERTKLYTKAQSAVDAAEEQRKVCSLWSYTVGSLVLTSKIKEKESMQKALDVQRQISQRYRTFDDDTIESQLEINSEYRLFAIGV